MRWTVLVDVPGASTCSESVVGLLLQGILDFQESLRSCSNTMRLSLVSRTAR